jgi:PTH1 family peptidyl-tRNA hydrolase
VKSEVIHWVLKKPLAEQRKAIDETIARSVQALPQFLSGEMEKAMLVVHTSKPPRPKPVRIDPPPATPTAAATQVVAAKL